MPHSPVPEEKLVGFPARCISLRQKLHVSKLELALWLGVGRSYVTVMEKGRQAPSKPVFQLIEKLEAAANLKQLAMHMPQPDTSPSASGIAGLPPKAIAALDQVQTVDHLEPAKPPQKAPVREKSAFAMRVATLRAQLGITRPKLAQRLGVSRQYITKIENGAHASLPVIKLIEKLEIELQKAEPKSATNLDHIIQSAPSAPTATKADSKTPTLSSSPPPIHGSPRVTPVPVLTIPATRDLVSPDLASIAAVEHLPFSVSDPQAFAMRLAGDAMQPQHHDGEIAILYPNSVPHTGNRVVARLSDSLGGDVLFRIYSKADHGHSIILSSLNTLYPPITLSPEEAVWIYPVATTIRQMLQ